MTTSNDNIVYADYSGVRERILHGDSTSAFHGYSLELLEAILRSAVLGGEQQETITCLAISDSIWVRKPRRADLEDWDVKRIPDQLIRFWGLIAANKVAYGVDRDGMPLYWKWEDGAWKTFLPIRSLGDDGMAGSGYAAIAWACGQLGRGHKMVTDKVSIDGITYSYDPDTDDLVADDSSTDECFVTVRRPDDYDSISDLQREAFGDAYEGLAMTAAYLVLPVRSQHYVIMEDTGGSGKTSFMHAFCKRFPGIACEDLNLSSLTKDGFTAGSALVQAVGKSVSFSEEAGTITPQIGAKMAALSTGSSFQIRYGNSISENRFLQLKMVISTNEEDELDKQAPFVARRMVTVPMAKLHDEQWWREVRNWRTRHAMIFSPEGIDALVIAGTELWKQLGGKFPETDAQAVLSEDTLALLKPSLDATVSSGCEQLVTPILWSDWLSGIPKSSKKRVTRELKDVAGISRHCERIDGSKPCWVPEIDDASKFEAVAERYGSVNEGVRYGWENE